MMNQTRPSRTARFTLLAAAGIALSATLLGCSGPTKNVSFGEPQSIEVEDESTKTKATLEFVMNSVDTVQAADITDSVTFSGDYANGTVYKVNYTVKITEGEFGADYSYPFSHYKWGAELADGSDIAVVNLGLRATIPGCEELDGDRVAEFASKKEMTACVAFVSANKGELSTVIYDQPTVSYKGRDKGYRWSVAQQ
ncbi:MAG: hypothetical protein WBA28_02060 [Microbacteriaceae bacterium]